MLTSLSCGCLDFYPRSPCGERRQKNINGRANYIISIHALLAESDACHQCHLLLYFLFLSTLSLRRATAADISARRGASISIHALLAESDAPWSARMAACFRFLSTLSLRRATVAPLLAVGRTGHFYPRSPCGERPPPYNLMIHRTQISIHALLAESDS